MKFFLNLILIFILSENCFAAEIFSKKISKPINLIQKDINIKLSINECELRSTNPLTQLYCNVNFSNIELKLPYGGKIIDISDKQKGLTIKNIERSVDEVKLKSFSLYFKEIGSTKGKAELKSYIQKNGILLKVKYQGPQF